MNDSSSDSKSSVYLGLTIGLPISASILIMAGLLVSIPCIIFCLRHRKRHLVITRQQRDYVKEKDMLPMSYSLDTLDNDRLDNNVCTSGSGPPLLTQRTVAHNIRLAEVIGRGRFGEVYRGYYHDDEVAVKIYSPRDEKSWLREIKIYNTALLHHDNILGFIASDMLSQNEVREMWLIIQFHEHGSVYDFLNNDVGYVGFSFRILLRMATTICVGLAHLHTELFGMQGKPSIAHRDIKSKNILVKKNLECCIADFGLAVSKDPLKGIDIPTNPKQGTKRYMAPEILSETINMNHFESFKQADMYSLGLVLWEIFRTHSKVYDPAFACGHELPFQNLVPPDPSFEDMRRIVVVEKIQPAIPTHWHSDDLMRELTKVLHECWYFTSSARPTAVYLKKKLNQLSSKMKLSYEERE